MIFYLERKMFIFSQPNKDEYTFTQIVDSLNQLH